MLLFAATGCAALAGARPRLIPAADALYAVVEPPPHIVTAAMAQELTRRGVPLRRVAPTEGYIESHWFDATTLASVPEPFGPTAGVVRLRLFADPVGRHARLFLEAVERIAWDPSVPERELERMVAADHPVRPLLRALVDGLTPVRSDSAGATTSPRPRS